MAGISRWLSLTGCLLGLLLVGGTVAAPSGSAQGRLPEVPIVGGEGGQLPLQLDGWRFRAGDNPSWADPEFDDRGWAVTSSLLEVDTLEDGVWPGIGWFRIHLAADSAYLNRPLGLVVRQSGASEVYLDGELLFGWGVVSASADEVEAIFKSASEPQAIILDHPGEHVLAVRYTSHDVPRVIGRRGFLGFTVTLGELESLQTAFIAKLDRLLKRSMFPTGVAFSFFVLHLFMFLFYPVAREHLYHSLFALSFAGLCFFPVHLESSSTMTHVFMAGFAFETLLALCAVMAPLVLYSIYYDRIPRQFWVIAAAGVVIASIGWAVQIQVLIYFATLCLAECLRVVAKAIIQRRDFAWVVGVGYLAFILSALVAMSWVTGIVGHEDLPPYLFHSGTLVLMTSLSLVMAHNYARTNRDLKLRLTQVQELSEKTVRQERAAAKQESKQKLMQAELAHQAKQLEEARKLEQALFELGQAHLKLRETQAQLVQSEKMASLGQLVAGVAHEINTPVGAIGSMNNTLVRALEKLKAVLASPADQTRDQQVQQCFKIIEDANSVIASGAERVTTIVRRLRSFTRLDEAELKTADIHKGIEDTLALLHHETKHGITIHRDYADLAPLPCFPSRLNQVFLNIMVNAIQAMEGQGEIGITTSGNADTVGIAFRDTGSGIPPEQLQKIFDPGFTTKGVGVGTGLGLSICYQIIQDHHGDIAAESTVGQGTTFQITLPTNLDEILKQSASDDS